MRESIVTVQVDTCIGIITTEPFAAPGIVVILALQDMVGSLEERLFNIKHTINV